MADSDAKNAATNDREFVITRVLSAPRSLVFQAWTEPKHLARWWGPHTFTNPVCELDVRPGGKFLIVMRAPDGSEYPFRGIYQEIKVPERIVYTDDCSAMPDEWHDMVDPGRDKTAGKPALESIVTVSFEELGTEKTRLTVHMLFASTAVREAMLEMQMAEGWTQSFERLEELLPVLERRRIDRASLAENAGTAWPASV